MLLGQGQCPLIMKSGLTSFKHQDDESTRRNGADFAKIMVEILATIVQTEMLGWKRWDLKSSPHVPPLILGNVSNSILSHQLGCHRAIAVSSIRFQTKHLAERLTVILLDLWTRHCYTAYTRFHGQFNEIRHAKDFSSHCCTKDEEEEVTFPRRP